MMFIFALLLRLTDDDLPRRLQADEQEGQEPEAPLPRRLEEPPPRPFEPLYPRSPGLRMSALWLQPAISYNTREYFTGVTSGDVDLGDRVDLPRFAPGYMATLDLGRFRLDAGFVMTSSKSILDRSLSYEEETYAPGEEVATLAYAGWLDISWRLRLAGGERGAIDALLAVHVPKVRIAVETDTASAREGFSALWPVPAVGVEGHYWLTERIRVYGTVMGSRIAYSNPLHQDAGEPQHLRYAYFRMEAGMSVDLGPGWGVTLGYTRFSLDVTQSAPSDDKDRAIFAGAGAFLALDLRF